MNRNAGFGQVLTSALWAWIILAQTAGKSVQGTESALIEVVPADAVAAYVSLPFSNEQSTYDGAAGLNLVHALADQALGMGLLGGMDSCARQWLDSLAALAEVAKFPFVFVLQEVRARARADGGHELSFLDAALVIECGDNTAAIERRIQHLLNTYTNSEYSELDCKDDGLKTGHTLQRLETGTTTPPPLETNRAQDSDSILNAFCTLRDKRLPDWAVFRWAKFGNYYVFGVGDRAFKGVTKTITHKEKSLAVDPWFARAWRSTSARTALSATFVRFVNLQDSLDKAFIAKIQRVLSALELDGAERLLWTTGLAGRDVRVECSIQREGRDETITIAGGKHLDAFAESAIPQEATRSAVFDFSPPRAFRRICDAYLASRSTRAQEKSRVFWRDVQLQTGVDFEKDLFAHLGRRVVIHDFPRHALRLPFARTIVFQIEGDAAALRKNIDQLFGFLRDRPEWLMPLSVQRSKDDIWYLTMGITGPAIGMTERRLVISFSPEAVRDVLALESKNETSQTIEPVGTIQNPAAPTFP